MGEKCENVLVRLGKLTLFRSYLADILKRSTQLMSVLSSILIHKEEIMATMDFVSIVYIYIKSLLANILKNMKFNRVTSGCVDYFSTSVYL